MSAQSKIRVGDTLFLSAQLGDGILQVSQVRIFVEFQRPDGVLIEPRFEIFHDGNGAFMDDSKVMPDEPVIHCKYFVTESDGVTIATDRYNPAIFEETFVKDLVGEIITENLDARVTSTACAIEGVLQSTVNLQGELQDVSVLEAELQDTVYLVGEIHEC